MPVSFCVRTPISALRKGRNSPAITAFTRLDLGAVVQAALPVMQRFPRPNGTDLMRSDAWERLAGAIKTESRRDAAPTGKMPLPRKLRKSIKSVPLGLGKRCARTGPASVQRRMVVPLEGGARCAACGRREP